MNTPDIEYVAEHSKNILWEIKKNYSEFYEYLMNSYPHNLSFSEKLYWYYHNISNQPICRCGKEVLYINFRKGYRRYCSFACSNADPIKIDNTKQTNNERYGGTGGASKILLEKARQTCLEKYGVEYYTQTDEYINRAKRTNRAKYGTDWGLQNTDIINKANKTYDEKYGGRGSASDIIKEKASQTCLERYGVKNAMESPQVREILEENNRERYGVKYPFQSSDIQDKVKQTLIDRYGTTYVLEQQYFKDKSKETRSKRHISKNPNIINIEYTGGDTIYTCKCPHPECDKCSEKTFTISSSKYCVRQYEGRELCTTLCPGTKHSNTTIEQFIKTVLDEHRVVYEYNNRDILDGKELDIYIPDKRIAIECNGVFWHSTKSPCNHPASYHFNKWIQCINKGIQLITVWEDQIVNKPDIVKSIILSKLEIYNKRYYARQCSIKEIDSTVCNQFLENNHLQGSANSRVRYGLYYGSELVSVMTFGLKRKCMGGKDEWELHRYCNKSGVQVVGGASKLFKHFIDEQKPIYIESFSSNDISVGELYKALGFECIKQDYGSYWYIDKSMKRYHRYNFRKDQLVREGYDDSKSESQIMDERGFYKIFDCGQTKWVKEIQ